MLALAWAAPAQTTGAPEAPASDQPAGTADDQSAPADEPAVQVSSGEVQISTELMGLGDVVRPGDWAGIRLALTDSFDRPRDVAVQLHMLDGDGDRPLYTRFVTLNPGGPVGVWLYAPMPWGISAGSVFRVSVSTVSTGSAGVEIGRQIAWAPLQVRRAVREQDGLVGVIGTATFGLEQYATTFRQRDESPGAHQVTHAISGLSPEVLPDVWLGLAAYSTLFWSDADPSRLSGSAVPQALREWVHRGGHLVIAVPAIGEAWSSPTGPLADILPVARAERVAQAQAAPYSAWLLGGDPRRLSGEMPLHRFVIPPDTDPRDATPIVVGPDGCVAVRRLIGTGMVTLLGLDPSTRTLARGPSPRADSFWPRLLGWRAATLSVSEIELYSKGTWGASRPGSVWVDDGIGASISKGREASVGVLLGLCVFAVYFLIAGPVGFSLLKRRGLERHSWLAFVGSAAFFTVVAWAGASWLRPKSEESWHFTLLDHVYGQPVQRASIFTSILLPTYGDQTVSLGDPEADAAWSQSLVPWIDPAGQTSLGFPDARPYLANVRSLTQLRTPARSTIKSFRGEWLGGPRWSMPGPVSADVRPTLSERGQLSGTLVHQMPGPLTNVTVLLVTRQVNESTLAVRRDQFVPRPLAGEAFAWSLTDPWEPGKELDLSGFVPDARTGAASFLSGIVPMVSVLDRGFTGEMAPDRADALAAFYGFIEQPDPSKFTGATSRSPGLVLRRSTHTRDVSGWITQPCLIVLGSVEGVASPVPMYIDGLALDGKQLPSSGRTVVRWIYPLEPRPAPVGGGPGAPPAGAGQPRSMTEPTADFVLALASQDRTPCP
jgi:hypothetical protein